MEFTLSGELERAYSTFMNGHSNLLSNQVLSLAEVATILGEDKKVARRYLRQGWIKSLNTQSISGKPLFSPYQIQQFITGVTAKEVLSKYLSMTLAYVFFKTGGTKIKNFFRQELVGNEDENSLKKSLENAVASYEKMEHVMGIKNTVENPETVFAPREIAERLHIKDIRIVSTLVEDGYLKKAATYGTSNRTLVQQESFINYLKMVLDFSDVVNERFYTPAEMAGLLGLSVRKLGSIARESKKHPEVFSNETIGRKINPSRSHSSNVYTRSDFYLARELIPIYDEFKGNEMKEFKKN